MNRRARRALAALLVAGAGVGHWAYWYAARPRPGSPRLPEARALLADPAWEAVLWVPAPHQNLGALDRRVGDVRAWLALLAETAGRPAPKLPRFGPWSAPPAEEWVVAIDERGAARAAAQVYPLAALVARVAGTLAGNRWLAGGEVRLGAGRSGRVAWRGRTWSFVSADAPEARAAPELELDATPVLGLLRLRREQPPLPGGLWRVSRTAGGEVVAELGRVDPPWIAGPGGEDPPAVWLAETSPGPIDGPSALLLWESGGRVEGFPRAALLEAGRASPFALPGARIARLAGLDPRREEGPGARRLAFDGASLAAAGGAESWLLEGFPGPSGGRAWRQFAAGANPGRAAAALLRAARHLERVPLLGDREGRRLRRAADLLAPWTGCGELALEVWREPDGARLRLCGAAAPR